MKKFKIVGLLQLIIVLTSHWTLVLGQKLPKIQKASIRAPADIKIDGNLSEWNNQFQAYNRGNYLYYTVSNDDANLYLTVHMEGIVGSRKIFRGGLTFTIVPSSKKANRLSVTFPAIPARKTNKMERLADGPLVYRILKSDTVANKAKIDSLIATCNTLMGKVYNQIQVKGIPGTNDTLISIYNTQGIKAGARADRRMKYCYELAVPLRYLGDAINNGEKFKYNIKLNIEPLPEVKTPKFSEPVAFGKPLGPGTASDQFLYNTTDFSGEYTLAKK